MRKLKYFICTAVSLVLTAFLFIHVSYMFRGYKRLMTFYGMEKNSVDVALVGTSVTFSAFMPMDAYEQYGFTAFDYATNMQFENSLRYSIREVMKTQSPKLLMVDVSPFISGHHPSQPDWDEENRKLFIKFNLDSMKYSKERAMLTAEIVRATGGSITDFLYWTFDIGRYHTNAPDTKQFDNSLYDVNRGFEYLSHNAGEIIDPEKLAVDDGSRTEFPEIEQKYLEELLKETDGLDCSVVYYCAPIYFENDQAKRKNELKAQITEHGYEFWDFSTQMEEAGLDPETDFWGYNHTDSLGAEKATALMAKRIHESFALPDRREDPAYDYWNKELEVWHKIKGWNHDYDRAT